MKAAAEKFAPSVRKGQIYRIPRPGKPAHHVKVVGLAGAKGPQPKIHYRPVTRTGGAKPLGLGRTCKRQYLVAFMTFVEGQWGPPPGWELCDGE